MKAIKISKNFSENTLPAISISTSIAVIIMFFAIYVANPNEHLGQLIVSTIAFVINLATLILSKKKYSPIITATFALITLYLLVETLGIF